jgi:HK97 family phage major capsid protein
MQESAVSFAVGDRVFDRSDPSDVGIIVAKSLGELRVLFDGSDEIVYKGRECRHVRFRGPSLPEFMTIVAKARGKGGIPDQERQHYHAVLKRWGCCEKHWQSKTQHWFDMDQPHQVQKTALAENSGVVGGYIVPPMIKTALMKSLAEKSFIFPRALTVPMPTLEVQLPLVKTNTSGSSGVSPFFGGMTFQCGVSEGTSISETEPSFGSVSLKAVDMVGYAKMSNQFLADSGPEMEAVLVDIFARAASWQAEYLFFQGTGGDNQQPLGMINAPAAKTATRATSNQIAATDIAAMSGLFIPEGWHNAIWVTNPSTFAQIQALANYFVNMGFHEGGAVGYLSNMPLYPSEKLPKLGSTGDLMLIDPSTYIIGIRNEIVIDADPHSLFNTYQTAYRVWMRFDGKPWLDSPVTLADGSTTASSIVLLHK